MRPASLLVTTALAATAGCGPAWILHDSTRVAAVADYARQGSEGSDVLGAGATIFFDHVWDDVKPHALQPYFQRASSVSLRGEVAWIPDGEAGRADLASEFVFARQPPLSLLLRAELALYSGLSPFTVEAGLRVLKGLELGVNVAEGSLDPDADSPGPVSDRPYLRYAFAVGDGALDLGLEAHREPAFDAWAFSGTYYFGKPFGAGLLVAYRDEIGVTGDFDEPERYELSASYDAPSFGLRLGYAAFVGEDYESVVLALTRRY